MSRQSSITTHPQREAIEKALAEGVAGAQISRLYGVSESAISRHRISRLDVLKAMSEDDTPDAVEVMVRLLEVADDARSTRRLTALSGTPVTRARAQNAELVALEKLADRLGLDDLTMVYVAMTAKALVAALRELADKHPESCPDLFVVMGHHEELIEFRDELRARVRKQKKA
jgi:hypothetical protein